MGDRIILFNGKGVTAEATIEGIGPRQTEIELKLGPLHKTEIPKPEIILASALPKGDRQRVMLDATTQLGMQTFLPLQCERSVAKIGSKQIERWQRICLEACKQSRRAYIPDIAPAVTVAEAISQMQAKQHVLWLADSQGQTTTPQQIDANGLVVFIGPEGGFTGNEIALLHDVGAHRICLSANILRTEVAAMAMLAQACRIQG